MITSTFQARLVIDLNLSASLGAGLFAASHG
jgi:hypothetical protein